MSGCSFHRRRSDNTDVIEFAREILNFKPQDVMPHVECPVLALFGEADPVVPGADAVSTLARLLLHGPDDHAISVFPSANHGLFVATPDSTKPRCEQLASA